MIVIQRSCCYIFCLILVLVLATKWSIQTTSHISTIVCDTATAIPTDTLVLIIANTDCVIDVVASTQDNWMSLELYNSSMADPLSYMYLEMAVDRSSHYSKRFISFSPDSKSCVRLFATKISKLHLNNAVVHARIREMNSSVEATVSIQNKPLLEGSVVAREICNTTHHDNVEIAKKASYMIFATPCPLGCTCTLAFQQWAKVCWDNGTDISTLLIYPSGLKTLKIYRMRLNRIRPGAFSCVPTLLNLYLMTNRLTTLEDMTFASLSDLKLLDLSWNRLKLVSRYALIGLIRLKYLLISNNKLVSLPSDLGLDRLEIHISSATIRYTSELESLTIENNRLILFEAVILNIMNSLRFLSLSKNRISILPAGVFAGLSELEWLHLHKNQLVSVPENIFNDLIRLRELVLNSNKITVIACIFTGIPNIIEIRLRNNRITTLSQRAFSNVSDSLRLLNLRYNSLSSLPEGIFGDLHMLKQLMLDNNRLAILPNNVFHSLYFLDILDIYSNELTSLPYDVFRSLSALSDLTLRNNLLHRLPDNVFQNVSSLTNLDIYNNSLIDISSCVFESLIKLEYLNMSQNNLNTLPSLDTLVALEILDLSYNRLIEIDADTFHNLMVLLFLSLEYNQINELKPGTFRVTSNLEVVRLGHNVFSSIPSGMLDHQKELWILTLSYNHIEELIPFVFSGLEQLKMLELNNNQIKTLTKGVFGNLTSITFINISYNMIQVINQHVFINSFVNTIDMRGNPLYMVTHFSFEGIHNSTLLLDESATCCFTDTRLKCFPANSRSPYLTCKRMLEDIFLRIAMWSLGIFAIGCNLLVLSLRCRIAQRSTQTFLISQLSLSDCTMGVSMVMLAFADSYYAQYFPSYSSGWISGTICKCIGFLSILSSEVSVFLITLITFDRYQGVSSPFSSYRLRLKSAKYFVALIWCIGVIISVTPVLLSGYFPDAYEVSEVCVGIPIVRRPIDATDTGRVTIEALNVQFKFYDQYDRGNDTYHTYGNRIVHIQPDSIPFNYSILTIIGYRIATYFSIIVFVGVNLFSFMIVAIMYIAIFRNAKRISREAGKSLTQREELRRASKMSVVVFTDFFTWVPLVIVCMLVQSKLITVGPRLYAWTVAFILPINSAINPFIYTIISFYVDNQTMKRKRKQQQQEKTKQTCNLPDTSISEGPTESNVSIKLQHQVNSQL